MAADRSILPEDTMPLLAGVLIADTLRHSSMHWGHMQIKRQLWEHAQPEFVSTSTLW